MTEQPEPGNRFDFEGLGSEGIGAKRSGGGSQSTDWSEQPTYTLALSRGSFGGLIVAIVIAVILFAVPLAWGIGAVSFLTQLIGLRGDDATLWLIYAVFVLFVAAIIWAAWNVFAKSFADTGQYRR